MHESLSVIPAKAGIQRKNKDWIPHQVRNDRKVTPFKLQGILELKGSLEPFKTNFGK
jgi:hypothetical protein